MNACYSLSNQPFAFGEHEVVKNTRGGAMINPSYVEGGWSRAVKRGDMMVTGRES
mgnify:FL=1